MTGMRLEQLVEALVGADPSGLATVLYSVVRERPDHCGPVFPSYSAPIHWVRYRAFLENFIASTSIFVRNIQVMKGQR